MAIERGPIVNAITEPDPVAGLMDVYVDWRDESAALEDAYGRWSSAPEAERDLAFAAYKAALDREEQASIVYRNQLRQLNSHRCGSR
jgi:hypothetical protein